MVVTEDDIQRRVRRIDLAAMCCRRAEMDSERGPEQDFYRAQAEAFERAVKMLREHT